MTKETASNASFLLSRICQLENELTRFESNTKDCTGLPINTAWVAKEDTDDMLKAARQVLKNKLIKAERDLKNLK